MVFKFFNNQKTRVNPNILITGTPGSGKSTICNLLAENLKLLRCDVTKIIQVYQCYDGYDISLQSHILNEEKLLDVMEPKLTGLSNVELEIHDLKSNVPGGIIVDYHACDFFPERWFDLILVLRVDTHILYDRLMERKEGYNHFKVLQNIECEIMQVLLEEAKESYSGANVMEITNNFPEDLENIIQWVRYWIDEKRINK